MRVAQNVWSTSSGWEQLSEETLPEAQLVLYFAAPSAHEAAAPYDHLRTLYPAAHIVGCTTGGEILGQDVEDDTVAATALHFASSRVETATVEIHASQDSLDAGRTLAARLPQDGLRAVIILADGMLTNGSALIDGLRANLPDGVTLTGGLAGDGPDFRQTFVGCDGPLRQGLVAAIGLYGEAIQVGWGSYGGWERFGPERAITRSSANVLHELDGEPALALYKRYLGEEAAHLPGSALFFPLTVRPPEDKSAALVRTIVAVDEQHQTMTFAGDIPEGWIAQLMRGHFDGLIDGACRAGEAAAAAAQCQGQVLALLISCIGRKMLMGQRVVEEVEVAAEALGPACAITGFYSYGEIAPHIQTGRCELHNQTMTITTIGEG